MTQTLNPNPQLRLEQVSLLAPVGSRYLLKELSTDLFPGERIILTGASSAGKTLFLQLLNRRLEPSSGKLYLNDGDIRQISPLKLRRSITLVPQEPKLLGMTVAQTLAYPLELRGIKPPEIQQRVQEWRERLHIPTSWMSRTEAQLSLGQRQQIVLTRSLIIQPAILLLDEPLMLLDQASRDRILVILTELSQTQQMTILISTRQLDHIQDFGQRVLYLQDGKLLQDLQHPFIDWQALSLAMAETELQDAKEWNEDDDPFNPLTHPTQPS